MKKISTTILTKTGEKKVISIYIDDETEQMLKEQCDEVFIHEYIIEEYKSQLIERKETRRHVSFDYLSQQGHDFESSEVDPVDAVQNADKLSEIAKAIAKLTLEQQEVVRLIYYENKTQVEVAEMKGVHKTAINKQLQRALAQLKKFLENL